MDPSRERLVEALLERHGRSFAAEAGIDLADNTPAPLFQMLCLSLLFSAKIGSDLAMDAMRALIDAGWTTAAKMADASWEERSSALKGAGYARFDERTSTMLGETAERVRDEYDGDLRELRNRSEREPDRQRELLKDFKGLGDVGVDIFFREVQAAWPELHPFADDKALDGARALGLPADAGELAEFVDRDRFPALVAALVRTELAGDADEVRRAAG
ncbi:MAG: hypothetical protein R3323_04365 [Wenzhouxiangellaceae bacterium]|nr:hypothetical protein [Wenzhouxiangellaceae bacterium]